MLWSCFRGSRTAKIELSPRRELNFHFFAKFDSSPWRVVAVDPTMLEPCGEHPCSCWIVRITRLAKLADRAFGAQRFSGGRAGRRFAPPSAAGSASRCHPSPPSPPHPNPTHLPTSIPTPPGFPESLLCSQSSKMLKQELLRASWGHFKATPRKCSKLNPGGSEWG